MVNRGGSSGRGGRSTSRLDDGSAALLHDGNEGVLVPSVVHQAFCSLALNGGMADIRVLRGRVVAPDNHLGDVCSVGAGFFGKLRQGAVVVKAGHRREIARVEIRRSRLRDQRVSIRRVTNYQHFDVARSVIVQCLALRPENSAVGSEQVFAFHAGTARTGTDQQGIVGILEGYASVIGRDNTGEQRESAVIELHHYTLQCTQCRRNFQQLQNNGLIRPQHIASSDAEGQCITDIAGGAGNGDTDRIFHMDAPVVKK